MGYGEDTTNLTLLMLAPLVSGAKNYSKMKKNIRRNENSRTGDIGTNWRLHFQKRKANNSNNNVLRCTRHLC